MVLPFASTLNTCLAFFAVIYLLSSWGFDSFLHEKVNKGLQGPFWCGLLQLYVWVDAGLAAAIEKRILVCQSNK